MIRIIGNAAIGEDTRTPEEIAASQPRPRLPKSTLIERVIDAGKINAVDAFLDANPIFKAQWNAPDWPNVYLDDPGLIIVLNAVGCTEAEILAITAP